MIAGPPVAVTVVIARVADPAVADQVAAPGPLAVPQAAQAVRAADAVDPVAAPARVGPAVVGPARARGGRPAASVPSHRPRPCTATPCWRRCAPSRFPWP